MKASILIFTFLFFFIQQGVAQSSNGLLVKKFKNEQYRLIEEGSKITIKKFGETYRGTFQIISKEALTIGSDTIRLEHVDLLCAKTSASNLGGGALSLLGIWAGTGGLTGTVVAVSEGSYALLLIPFTASIAALGTFGAIKGIQLLSRGKKYKSFRWEYVIVKDKIPNMAVQK